MTSITRTPPDVLVGDTVTWTATADDVSNADDAAGFQYAFNGGGYGPVDANTFDTSYSTCGTYSVTVTAKDKDGGISDPVTSTATVNVYDGVVLPPLSLGVDNLVQKGQVVPVKIRFSCHGVPLNGLTPAIQLLKGDKTGQPNDAPDEVITESVSGADTTGVMRNVDSMYLYNLRVPTAINGVGLVKGNQLTIRIRPFAPGNTTSRIDIVLQIRK